MNFNKPIIAIGMFLFISHLWSMSDLGPREICNTYLGGAGQRIFLNETHQQKLIDALPPEVGPHPEMQLRLKNFVARKGRVGVLLGQEATWAAYFSYDPDLKIPIVMLGEGFLNSILTKKGPLYPEGVATFSHEFEHFDDWDSLARDFAQAGSKEPEIEALQMFSQPVGSEKTELHAISAGGRAKVWMNGDRQHTITNHFFEDLDLGSLCYPQSEGMRRVFSQRQVEKDKLSLMVDHARTLYGKRKADLRYAKSTEARQAIEKEMEEIEHQLDNYGLHRKELDETAQIQLDHFMDKSITNMVIYKRAARRYLDRELPRLDKIIKENPPPSEAYQKAFKKREFLNQKWELLQSQSLLTLITSGSGGDSLIFRLGRGQSSRFSDLEIRELDQSFQRCWPKFQTK